MISVSSNKVMSEWNRFVRHVVSANTTDRLKERVDTLMDRRIGDDRREREKKREGGGKPI